MLRYAARAIPWPSLLVAGALAVSLLEIVRHWPGPTWALVGSAVGLLAGAAAWACDERAAAPVVDAAPRTLAWRTAARGGGVALLGAGWLSEVYRVRGAMNGHATEVALWGVGGVLAGASWATWRRSGGDAAPGTTWAAVVVPGATAVALGQGLVKQVPVFPFVFDQPGHWATSTTGWLIAAGLAAALLGAALADARWWHLRVSSLRRE
jgi:hypothetical protein